MKYSYVSLLLKVFLHHGVIFGEPPFIISHHHSLSITLAFQNIPKLTNMLRGAQRLAVLIFIFSMICLFSAWCNLLKKNARTPSPVVNPKPQAIVSIQINY